MGKLIYISKFQVFYADNFESRSISGKFEDKADAINYMRSIESHIDTEYMKRCNGKVFVKEVREKAPKLTQEQIMFKQIRGKK